MQDKIDLKNFQLPEVPKKTVGIVVVLALLLLVAFSSWYQVEPEEVGVVLRFGEYARTTDPGLNFNIPFAESVFKLPVQRQLKDEFGFRTQDPGVRTIYRREGRGYLDESLMLTGDLNSAVVEWIVQYKIADPYRYLFKVRNTRQTFRDITEAVMRGVVGDRTVTEVLTIGRQEIEDTVKVKLQKLCEQYETGIFVDQVVLQNVNPPDVVKPSFNEVNQAQQERDKKINEARADYNKVIPLAKGKAAQVILQSEGKALERINQAEGDANRFNAVYEAYREAPEVTRSRYYLEALNQVLPKVGRKIIIDKDAKSVIPLLQLGNRNEVVKGDQP